MNKIHESQEVTAEEMHDAMQDKLDWFERSDDNVAVCFGVCLFFAGPPDRDWETTTRILC